MSDRDAPVALVTNGTSGVGLEIVRCLNDAGTTVAVGDRPRELNGSAEVPKEAASLHHGLVTSPADCERVVKEVLEQHGRLDILTCVALRRGVGADCPIERYGASEWDRHWPATSPVPST